MEKTKVARNEKQTKTMHVFNFHVPNIWQIFKCFARSFHQAYKPLICHLSKICTRKKLVKLIQFREIFLIIALFF